MVGGEDGEVTDGALQETYVFTSVEKFPLCFLRGDFMLHPDLFHLLAGQSKTFKRKIAFRQETVFPDETFENDMDVVLYMAMGSGLFGRYGDTYAE